MSALNERAYALRRMAALLGGRPGSFVIGVAMCAAALSIPLFTVALLQAALPASQRLQSGPEVAVFVSIGTPQRQLEALQSRLAALEGVRAVRLIPRDQAYAELSRRAGLAAGGGAAPDARNPLPDVLVARFALKADPARVEQAAKAVRAWSEVDAVQSNTEWHRRLLALLHVITNVVLILGGLAAALIVLVLATAAYAQTQVRSDESRLLRTVGARTSFIVRPFAYAGALTLGLGATLALAIGTAALVGIEPPLQALAQQFAIDWVRPRLPAAGWVAFVGAAAAAGWVAAWIGARTALMQDEGM